MFSLLRSSGQRISVGPLSRRDWLTCHPSPPVSLFSSASLTEYLWCTNPRADYKSLWRVFRLAVWEQKCWLHFSIWKWGIMNVKKLLCSCHFLPSLSLTTKLSALFLPFFYPAHSFLLSQCFSRSIASLLSGPFSTSGMMNVPHLTPWLVKHQISNSLSILLTLSRHHSETHKWKHTLNSRVHTLSDAQSVNWRPSFHGKHPMRPHWMCMCLWETERGRDSERVHTPSLSLAVDYSYPVYKAQAKL